MWSSPDGRLINILIHIQQKFKVHANWRLSVRFNEERPVQKRERIQVCPPWNRRARRPAFPRRARSLLVFAGACAAAACLSLALRRRRGVRGSPTAPGKCVFPADCTRRTCTLPRVRSAVVLPTEGDPRRIRSLQRGTTRRTFTYGGSPPPYTQFTAGTRVQPAVLFTCGGCSQFLYIPPYMYACMYEVYELIRSTLISTSSSR